MKKLFLVALTLFLLSACTPEPLNSVNDTNDTPEPLNSVNDTGEGYQIIGGQTDDFGCLGPAGYSYNDEIGACIREWELGNENVRKAAKMAVEHVGWSKGLTIIEVLVMRCPGCFTVNLQIGEEHPKINKTISITNWEISDEPEVIGHTVGQPCETDNECITPGEFLLQSNCPFGSACIEGQCAVICPLNVECSDDAECDCSERNERTLECLCVNGMCASVEAKNEIYMEY